MANERSPDDPYRSPDDPYRPQNVTGPYNVIDDDTRRRAPLDNELQIDPEVAEGPAGGGRIALYAVAVAVVLGAVFYGLNGSSISPPGPSATAQNTTQTSPPVAPPGMRDVTPRANTEPGTTTGAAPASK